MHEGRTYLKGLHEVRLDGILHEDSKSTSDTKVVGSDRLATLARRHDHCAEALTHVRETGGQREDSHALARDGDVEAGLAGVALLSGVLSDGDLTQVAVVDVNDAVPGDGLRVNVETSETVDLLRSEVVWVCLVDTELLQTLEHERRELALALLRGNETTVEGFVGLRGLMEHTSVKCSSCVNNQYRHS